MIRVILAGASGRMGQRVSHLIKSHPDLKIVAGIDINKNDFTYPLYPEIKNVKEEADIILDFSGPALLNDLLNFAKEKKIPIVIAQTKLNSELKEKISEASLEIPVFFAPNLAFNVLLFKRLVKEATRLFKDFDIEIVEKHHREKKDAPSGTALSLFEEIQKERKDLKINLSRNEKGLRENSEVGIHAIRGGSVFGEHEVLFIGDEEVFTFKHEALNRDTFAKGAIRALIYLSKKTKGYYTVENLFLEEKND